MMLASRNGRVVVVMRRIRAAAALDCAGLHRPTDNSCYDCCVLHCCRWPNRLSERRTNARRSVGRSVRPSVHSSAQRDRLCSPMPHTISDERNNENETKTVLLYKKVKGKSTYMAPQDAYCSCSGAVRHRQSGRTAYRP